MFLTSSVSTTSPNFFNLPISKSYTFVFKLLKLVRTLPSLLMSSLLTSAFETMKYFLTAKSDVSMPLTSFNSFSVA